MKIEITNFSHIREVSNLMHDAVFSKDDTEYDYEQKVFRLDTVRFMWERAERKGFLRSLKAPWIKCRLELQTVLECKIDEYEKFDKYEFSSIEVDKKKHKLLVYTAVGIEIELIIGEVKGYFYDIGNPIDKGVSQ